MRSRRFSLSNLSIKHRLPLLIGTLLLGIILVSTWASYLRVREPALEVRHQRLLNVTQQSTRLLQHPTALLPGRTITANGYMAKSVDSPQFVEAFKQADAFRALINKLPSDLAGTKSQ